MSRRAVTRPQVRIDGHWLSTIVPSGGGWDSLRHSTRRNGGWQASWSITAPEGWRHPLLRFGALVEIYLGPVLIWSGTLDEPDWDGMEFVALGACRAGNDAIGFDATETATTVPNTAIDQAIARGVLPWTRDDDFGTTPVGEEGDSGGLVTVTSILDAWADENDSDWFVTPDRRLIIRPTALTTPSWHVLPGSGALGSAADDRADRVFVRYVSDSTGRLATASYPAATPAGGVEVPIDVTDRGAMSATKAADIAEARWNELNGESGWTNGLSLIHGQVTTPGAIPADLALIQAGETQRLLGVPDPRGLSRNLDVVIGDTDYDWTADEIQVNPRGLAARTDDAVLERVADLAADARRAASGRTSENEQSGEVTISTSGGSGSQAVAFDREFAVPPVIQVSANLGGWIATWTDRSTTGFTVFVVHRSGSGSTSVTVSWSADLPTQ